MQNAVETVVASLAPGGFDPYAGRKLFSLARRAGFTDVRVSIEPYHLYAGSIVPENECHWRAKLDIAKPLMRDALGSDDAAAELTQRFLNYLSDPDTLTYSILFTVIGIKPEVQRPKQ